MMQYKLYASEYVHIKIHTIRHMLISMLLAADTLCTTDLYNIHYAIDMLYVDMPYTQICAKDVYRAVYFQTDTIDID